MSDSSGKTDRYRYHLTYHVKLHTGASQKQKITGDVKTLFIPLHPVSIAHVVGKISRAKIFRQSMYNFIRIHIVSIAHIVEKILGQNFSASLCSNSYRNFWASLLILLIRFQEQIFSASPQFTTTILSNTTNSPRTLPLSIIINNLTMTPHLKTVAVSFL